MLIRRADASDSALIAPLLSELGYPTTPDAVAARFERVDGSTADAAWLAVTDDGEPIGFASGHRHWLYELDAPVAELTALVVTEASRGTGAGRKLAAVFAEWCESSGCASASVSSALRRVEAHAFYEHLGYVQRAKKLEKSF